MAEEHPPARGIRLAACYQQREERQEETGCYLEQPEGQEGQGVASGVRTGLREIPTGSPHRKPGPSAISPSSPTTLSGPLPCAVCAWWVLPLPPKPCDEAADSGVGWWGGGGEWRR